MSELRDQLAGLSPQRLTLLCMQLSERLAALEGERAEPIAILGMGCRFPGGVEDPESYWQLLQDGVDAIGPVPSDRWDVDGLYDAQPDQVGKMYCKHGGFLNGIDLFDPAFFDITPREAINMDPQQRLLLEVSWEAMERAALSPQRLAGSRTGVYVGIFLDDYTRIQMRIGDPRLLNAYTGTGNTFSIAAGRISYVLGLHGPNMAIDTACSASLVALHLACQSLRSRESDVALAGGVNLILAPDSSIFLCQAHALSPDGRSKTFDASADGYARSEGCGMVVLKRLSDAVAARDPILAVIRGTATNHDGPSSGLTVPNGVAQEAVIRAALANAGLAPGEVSHIEAHGTGTPLGDPIEMRSLGAVYAPHRTPEEPLLVSSVKTNIGHAESAAGVAGLIKLVLALQRRELPPHLHLRELNPHISLADGRLAIPRERTPWEPRSGRRIAGLSSFGLSGSNAHLLVEEAPVREGRPASAERPVQLVVASAKTEAALRQLAGRYATRLAALDPAELPKFAYTTGAGRGAFRFRLAVTGGEPREIAEALAAFETAQEATVVSGEVAGWAESKVVFCFTGQGAQYPGMGQRLYASEPVYRQAIDRCDALLRPVLARPLLEVLAADDAELLAQTQYTQPALFALEWALAELWRSWGVLPSAVVGHSVGEYVAACVAGVMSVESALTLVAERGRLMQELPAGGAMAAVFAGEERVAPLLAEVAGAVGFAAINGPDGVVLSGAEAPLESVLARLAELGVRSQRLVVSHAFHSPLMAPIRADFERAVAQVELRPPALPFVSTVTGRALGDGQLDRPSYWADQILAPVRYAAALEELDRLGYRLFLELGPHPVLTALGRRCLAGEGRRFVATLRRGHDDAREARRALGELYVDGLEIDWDGVHAGEERQRIELPTYPWQRKRYWVEGEPAAFGSKDAGRLSGPRHPRLGQRIGGLAQGHVWESDLEGSALAFLEDHRIGGLVVAPLAFFLELAAAASEVVLGVGSPTLRNVELHRPLFCSPGSARVIQVCLDPEGAGGRFAVYSRNRDGAESWTLHATAALERPAPVGASHSVQGERQGVMA